MSDYREYHSLPAVMAEDINQEHSASDPLFPMGTDGINSKLVACTRALDVQRTPKRDDQQIMIEAAGLQDHEPADQKAAIKSFRANINRLIDKGKVELPKRSVWDAQNPPTTD